MTTLIKYTIALGIGFLILSCSSSPSIQKYYVEKQEDADFIAIDVPSSLIMNSDMMEADQKEVLGTIKKMNVLALQKSESKMDKYQSESERINEILSNEKYKTLMRYGSNSSSATLKYLGDEDAIDEVIVFAKDDERGLALFRVIGKDMNPGKIMQMLSKIDNDSFDFSFLNNLEAQLQ